MRRMLLSGLAGVLVSGCAGTDVTGRPPDPGVLPSPDLPPTVTAAPSLVAAPTNGWEGLLDDAVERLAPALGPAGAALGAPFRQLRQDGPAGGAVAVLIGATRRQFEALAGNLPPDLAPDADAFRMTLDALAALAAR